VPTSLPTATLGLYYLLPPGDDGYSRVAVGNEGATPTLEDVAGIYY
jgi:hypothetical protein